MPNPIQFIKSAMGISSPKQMVMKMMSNTNNPMINNLVDMANRGDMKGIEEFARNFCNERGRNFDSEFSEFIKILSSYQHS